MLQKCLTTTFLITKDKDICVPEWIQFELHADDRDKPGYLFSEVRSARCQIDVAGIFCQASHHSCFITRSTFSKDSV